MVMANFFNRNKKKNDLTEDILDTDEGKITKQYNVYLNYLKRLHTEFLDRGAEFMGYKKRSMATSNR